MSDERKLPQGRLSRFARLAATGVRTGAGLLFDRDGSSTAKQAAEALGTLRGLAAKIGQMASYVDGIVPEEHRHAYETALSALRAQAPTSAPLAVRAAVEEDLGAPMTELFAEWDEAPVASASIGQVHRARLHDGREVAVKVQHPGIHRAVESDLASASILESLASVGGARKFQTKDVLAVIKQRFREELDYALEAERIGHFTRVHAGDPTVRIPALIASRSGKRVLTTEFVRGATFEEACEASEPERRAWAETLWRFVFKGNLVGGQFNADPHPGNYIFHDAGRVTFLDFGCVQPIDAGRLDWARRIHRAALVRDEPTFRYAVCGMLGSKPGRLEKMAVDYTRKCFIPLFESPHRMTRPYAASLVDGMKEMAMVGRKLEDSEFFTMPSDMVFINRLQFGFYSVLARMDVEVDYAAVEAAFMPGDTTEAA
ncbi:MAG: ABC1 kinase family protein [Polyangiaceae bacterium]|jgi:predicted unusual protein kinase regulating ubiquinone biosynthesis (AarF/ABC1/UbiB family)